MATVSCPAGRFLAHGLLAHTALPGVCHARYLIQLLVSAVPYSSRGVHSSCSLVCLFVSLSQQTGSTNWPLETASSGADVYIFSHFDDDLNRQNLC